MRYYVMAVQHNKEKDAENRTVPKAFDSKKDAVAEYHRQLGEDMRNTTLDWSFALVINSEGNTEKAEKWEDEVEEEKENDII